jgi:hypothetical protein
MSMYLNVYYPWIGGGCALKKIASSGGRRENVGVFRVKNHDFTQKIIFFPILEGGRPGAPPLDPPLAMVLNATLNNISVISWRFGF